MHITVYPNSEVHGIIKVDMSIQQPNADMLQTTIFLTDGIRQYWEPNPLTNSSVNVVNHKGTIEIEYTDPTGKTCESKNTSSNTHCKTESNYTFTLKRQR